MGGEMHRESHNPCLSYVLSLGAVRSSFGGVARFQHGQRGARARRAHPASSSPPPDARYALQRPSTRARTPLCCVDRLRHQASSPERPSPIPEEEANPIPMPMRPGSVWWDRFVRYSTLATNLFPVWTLLCAGAAMWRPSVFLWLPTSCFTLGLAVLMLSMGITLSLRDFQRVLERPGAVAIGFIGCYALMPALALALSRLLALPKALAAGMVLVGSINGGQASNLCTYIANGNVALSVMMTTSTTIGAIVMTPFLCKVLLGAVVPVDAVGIAWSTVQVVLLPIALGMLLNRYANRLVQRVLPFSPLVGVVSTCLLVGSAVAQVADAILSAGLALQVSVFLLHLFGGICGYLVPRLAGYNEVVCRTTAIETAMKSSAFGFLLAKLHFAGFAVRVPSAVSVVWMSLMGSTMAVIWRYMPVRHPISVGERSVEGRDAMTTNAPQRGESGQGA